MLTSAYLITPSVLHLSCAYCVLPENCSMQKKGNISNAERTAKVCETELNSRIDFGKCLCLCQTVSDKLRESVREGANEQTASCPSPVYKVRLEEFTDGLSTDIYTMRVMEVIKEGG